MAKVLAGAGLLLPEVLTPSEECLSLRRGAHEGSRAESLIEIGVHGLSAREFTGGHIKSFAFLHFNEDVLRNVGATYPETVTIDFNSQMHSFAEWASSVAGGKWFILLTLVGLQEDDAIMTAYWKVTQLAGNLQVEF